MTAAIERLREFWEKAQCGPIVGFRTRFRSSDDQDQTLVNAAGEELAVTYSENTARVIAAAMNALPALLECAEAVQYIAETRDCYHVRITPDTPSYTVDHFNRTCGVCRARAALDALAKEVGT